MSDIDSKITSAMGTFVTKLDASQLPSSEMEGLPQFLRMLFSFKVIAGYACAKVAIVEVELVAAVLESTSTKELGVGGTVKANKVV